jgi:iron complex outermembrane recepter protein
MQSHLPLVKLQPGLQFNIERLMTTIKLFNLLLLLGLIAGAQSTSASDDVIPEIIVTADFRQSTELKTASSITVLTEEIIRSRSAQHFDDLVNVIPNLNYASGSNRARFFQIRGIGERSQFASPVNSSVGLLIDNVDFSGAGSTATMMDVEQVEVLRGPQGTRYGANALAGLINIKTYDPSDTFSAQLRAGAADYNTRTLAGMLTGPLSESILGRLAIEKHESDGYYENDFLDSEENNSRDELTVRGKLHIKLSDSWNLNLSTAYIDMDNGYDAFSLDNNRHTLSDAPGHDRQESMSLAMESTWATTNFDVVGILSASNSDIEYGYDEDWTFEGIHPWGYSSFDNYSRDRNNQSAEIRLISNDNSKIFAESTDWVVGIYALSSEEDLSRRYTYLPSDFTSGYDFDTYATFFQLDTSLAENLELSTGLRLEKRRTYYKDSDGSKFTPDENFWGGRIALKYFTNESTMIYGSIARGYKAGGFNTDGSLDEDLREFDEEYLIEYEAGIKSKLLNDRLSVRATFFYDERHDQQVKSSIVRVRPDGSSEFIDFLGNAAEGTNKGLEIEADWYATDNLNLSAALGLLDATFDSFINEFGEDLSGRDQAQAPKYTYHLAADYLKNNWQFQVSADGKDDFYFSDRHGVKSESYTLFNANIGYSHDSWKVSLWGRNLTDKDVFTRAFGSFGNDPRNGYITEPYYQYGEPRVVGVTFELKLTR